MDLPETKSKVRPKKKFARPGARRGGNYAHAYTYYIVHAYPRRAIPWDDASLAPQPQFIGGLYS